MLEEVLKAAKIEQYEIVKTVKGEFFEGMKYEHPLLDRIPELGKFVIRERISHCSLGRICRD